MLISRYLKDDLAAGFVVFLVALPLCLGIALASEAPPISGLITGIVAGMVVSLISGSELSVSGPAAGLAVTIVTVQGQLGSFEGLLVATMAAGVIQVAFGAFRAGLLATFFPSCVIKGMLAGIGIIIIFKQIPLAVGWRGQLGTEDGMFCVFSSFCLTSVYTFLAKPNAAVSFAALAVSIPSIFILVEWERLTQRYGGFSKLIPGPLLVVLFGLAVNGIFLTLWPHQALTAEGSQLVVIPKVAGLSEFVSHGPKEVWSWLSSKAVWSAAFVIALIASVETLLSIEATDKLDPFRRISRPNRELVAQGIGNVLAGFLGGIPMTSVIVRSSANVYAGGRTRLSAFVHGCLILVSVMTLSSVLNRVPLASLAAILIVIGYKLTNKGVVTQMWRSGYSQVIPFAITSASVVIFDLLSGVMIGTIVGLIMVLLMNHHRAFTLVMAEEHYYLRFAKDVTFLQKIAFKKVLAQLPDNTVIFIDGGGAMFIDHDILEVLEDFKNSAIRRNISVVIRNMPESSFDLLAALRGGAL